jgi:Domain of unknown function (DUF4178)
MEILLAVLIGSSCAALGAWFVKRRRAALSAGDAPAQLPASSEQVGRELSAALPGDVVIHEGRDWIVAGSARLCEGTESWLECRLVDGDDERWMVVIEGADDYEEVDRQNCALLGSPTPDPGVGSQPSESVEHDGLVYRLARLGSAMAQPSGELAPLGAGRWRHWLYERPGDRVAWFRSCDASWIYVFGHRVGLHMLRFLPGAGDGAAE